MLSTVLLVWNSVESIETEINLALEVAKLRKKNCFHLKYNNRIKRQLMTYEYGSDVMNYYYNAMPRENFWKQGSNATTWTLKSISGLRNIMEVIIEGGTGIHICLGVVSVMLKSPRFIRIYQWHES
jgi:hypothetical protein